MSEYKRVLLPRKIRETKLPDNLIHLDKLLRIINIKELNSVGITHEHKPDLKSSLHSLNNGIYLSITGLTDKYEYICTSKNILQVDETNNYIKKNDKELPQEEITIHLSFHVSKYDDYGNPIFSNGLHVKSGAFGDFASGREDRRMKKILCSLLNNPDTFTLKIINDFAFSGQKINFWDLQKFLIESISKLMSKHYNSIIIKDEILLTGEDLYNYRVKELASVEEKMQFNNKKIQEIKNMTDYETNRLKYDKEIKNIRDTIGLLNLHINNLLGMKPDEFKKIIESKIHTLPDKIPTDSSETSLYKKKYIKYKEKYLNLKNRLKNTK
jgi:hypothetical protein